jgi:hypothetical protein
MAYMTYGVSSDLTFQVVERPGPGTVRVLHPFGEAMELLHLAADTAHAEEWLRVHHYRGAFLDPVSLEDASSAPISLQA